MMHDSFSAHCLPTDFFFFFCLEPARKILHERREIELRNTVLKYCCLILIGSLLSYGDQSNQPSLPSPSPPPPSARGFPGCQLLETDCRQDVGISPSEWTLIHWLEKKAFRNVSFVKIAWLFKKDREMLNVLCVGIDSLFLFRLLSFQKLKYRAL